MIPAFSSVTSFHQPFLCASEHPVQTSVMELTIVNSEMSLSISLIELKVPQGRHCALFPTSLDPTIMT